MSTYSDQQAEERLKLILAVAQARGDYGPSPPVAPDPQLDAYMRVLPVGPQREESAIDRLRASVIEGISGAGRATLDMLGRGASTLGRSLEAGGVLDVLEGAEPILTAGERLYTSPMQRQFEAARRGDSRTVGALRGLVEAASEIPGRVVETGVNALAAGHDDPSDVEYFQRAREFAQKDMRPLTSSDGRFGDAQSGQVPISNENTDVAGGLPKGMTSIASMFGDPLNAPEAIVGGAAVALGAAAATTGMAKQGINAIKALEAAADAAKFAKKSAKVNEILRSTEAVKGGSMTEAGLASLFEKAANPSKVGADLVTSGRATSDQIAQLFDALDGAPLTPTLLKRSADRGPAVAKNYTQANLERIRSSTHEEKYTRLLRGDSPIEIFGAAIPPKDAAKLKAAGFVIEQKRETMPFGSRPVRVAYRPQDIEDLSGIPGFSKLGATGAKKMVASLFGTNRELLPLLTAGTINGPEIVATTDMVKVVGTLPDGTTKTLGVRAHSGGNAAKRTLEARRTKKVKAFLDDNPGATVGVEFFSREPSQSKAGRVVTVDRALAESTAVEIAALGGVTPAEARFAVRARLAGSPSADHLKAALARKIVAASGAEAGKAMDEILASAAHKMTDLRDEERAAAAFVRANREAAKEAKAAGIEVEEVGKAPAGEVPIYHVTDDAEFVPRRRGPVSYPGMPYMPEMGPGLYTTSSPDAANAYAAMRGGGGGRGSTLRMAERPGVKFLDMEAPPPPEVRRLINELWRKNGWGTPPKPSEGKSTKSLLGADDDEDGVAHAIGDILDKLEAAGYRGLKYNEKVTRSMSFDKFVPEDGLTYPTKVYWYPDEDIVKGSIKKVVPKDPGRGHREGVLADLEAAKERLALRKKEKIEAELAKRINMNPGARAHATRMAYEERALARNMDPVAIEVMRKQREDGLAARTGSGLGPRATVAQHLASAAVPPPGAAPLPPGLPPGVGGPNASYSSDEAMDLLVNVTSTARKGFFDVEEDSRVGRMLAPVLFSPYTQTMARMGKRTRELGASVLAAGLRAKMIRADFLADGERILKMVNDKERLYGGLLIGAQHHLVPEEFIDNLAAGKAPHVQAYMDELRGLLDRSGVTFGVDEETRRALYAPRVRDPALARAEVRKKLAQARADLKAGKIDKDGYTNRVRMLNEEAAGYILAKRKRVGEFPGSKLKEKEFYALLERDGAVEMGPEFFRDPADWLPHYIDAGSRRWLSKQILPGFNDAIKSLEKTRPGSVNTLKAIYNQTVNPLPEVERMMVAKAIATMDSSRAISALDTVGEKYLGRGRGAASKFLYETMTRKLVRGMQGYAFHRFISGNPMSALTNLSQTYFNTMMKMGVQATGRGMIEYAKARSLQKKGEGSFSEMLQAMKDSGRGEPKLAADLTAHEIHEIESLLKDSHKSYLAGKTDKGMKLAYRAMTFMFDKAEGFNIAVSYSTIWHNVAAMVEDAISTGKVLDKYRDGITAASKQQILDELFRIKNIAEDKKLAHLITDKQRAILYNKSMSDIDKGVLLSGFDDDIKFAIKTGGVSELQKAKAHTGTDIMHFSYSKENKQMWVQRSLALQMIDQFQSYGRNQFSFVWNELSKKQKAVYAAHLLAIGGPSTMPGVGQLMEADPDGPFGELGEAARGAQQVWEEYIPTVDGWSGRSFGPRLAFGALPGVVQEGIPGGVAPLSNMVDAKGLYDRIMSFDPDKFKDPVTGKVDGDLAVAMMGKRGGVGDDALRSRYSPDGLAGTALQIAAPALNAGAAVADAAGVETLAAIMRPTESPDGTLVGPGRGVMKMLPGGNYLSSQIRESGVRADGPGSSVIANDGQVGEVRKSMGGVAEFVDRVFGVLGASPHRPAATRNVQDKIRETTERVSSDTSAFRSESARWIRAGEDPVKATKLHNKKYRDDATVADMINRAKNVDMDALAASLSSVKDPAAVREVEQGVQAYARLREHQQYFEENGDKVKADIARTQAEAWRYTVLSSVRASGGASGKSLGREFKATVGGAIADAEKANDADMVVKYMDLLGDYLDPETGAWKHDAEYQGLVSAAKRDRQRGVEGYIAVLKSGGGNFTKADEQNLLYLGNVLVKRLEKIEAAEAAEKQAQQQTMPTQ